MCTKTTPQIPQRKLIHFVKGTKIESKHYSPNSVKKLMKVRNATDIDSDSTSIHRPKFR